MLKIDNETLERMEQLHPSIKATILQFEGAALPPCTRCGSENTADVQIGVIGRTIHIASATTKFLPVPNGPKRGNYFCYVCNDYFD
jgi:hypothetical protein